VNRTLIWILAVVLTLALSVWQRRTGPTYPVSGSVAVEGKDIRYRLDRSFAGPGDAPVRIPAPPPLAGTLEYRPAGTNGAWTQAAMVREGEELAGALPHRPMASKVEYRVTLRGASESAQLGPVTLRFRESVPAAVLIPHILAMFLGFLFAARAGLGAAAGQESRRFAIAALVVLGIGGLILGPIVQKIALGAFWTGWPIGPDLTDNKTFVAWACWLPAVLSRRRQWVVIAALVTFVVFAIPHSVLSGNVVR
jgi:hypothetical protein